MNFESFMATAYVVEELYQIRFYKELDKKSFYWCGDLDVVF